LPTLVRAPAAELDPDSADVQVTLGITELGPRRWIVGEDLLSKALALDPNHGEVLSFYSCVLFAVGRVKEAVAMKERLDQLESYVPLYVGNLGEALWVDGQNDAAIAVLKLNLGRQGQVRRLDSPAFTQRWGSTAKLPNMPIGIYQTNIPLRSVLSRPPGGDFCALRRRKLALRKPRPASGPRASSIFTSARPSELSNFMKKENSVPARTSAFFGIRPKRLRARQSGSRRSRAIWVS